MIFIDEAAACIGLHMLAAAALAWPALTIYL